MAMDRLFVGYEVVVYAKAVFVYHGSDLERDPKESWCRRNRKRKRRTLGDHSGYFCAHWCRNNGGPDANEFSE